MTKVGEIVLYINQPYTKYRWLSYICTAQIGFALANLLLMPTPKLIEDRAKSIKDKDNKLNSTVTSLSQPITTSENASTWESIKALDYQQIFSPLNALENFIHRPWTSSVMLVALTLIPSASFIYCKRNAHMITLLPNERIRFTSFSPFGLRKPSSLELPLRDVSCVQGRKAKHNFSVLKFRGYIGYHLVHKIQGQFLEPKLYDHHLGYARSWAVKD